MRTEIQKKFLIEHGIDPLAEGKLIDNLFTYPKFIRFELKEKALAASKGKLNAKEENQRMENNQEVNQAPQAPMNTAMPIVTTPNVEQPQTNAAAPQTQEVAQAPVVQNEFSGLDNSGQIEKQTFDPTPYIGKDSFIEYIEERKGQFGFYIKLFSQVIDEGDWEIRASTIYGLDVDKNGKLGWAPDSKLYNFLKKFNVAHYRDLMLNPTTQVLKDDKGENFRRISGGVKTPIKIQTRQVKDKEYLTF